MNDELPKLTAGTVKNPSPGKGNQCCGSCGSVDVYVWNAKGRIFPFQGVQVKLTRDLDLLTCSSCEAVNLMLGDSNKLNEYLEKEVEFLKSVGVNKNGDI